MFSYSPFITARVHRWVKWTYLVQYWGHSLASAILVTCHWTAKVTCWSLTLAMTAFCCWTVSWNCNASSLTATLKSICGGHCDSTATNTHRNCTFYTTTAFVRLTLHSSHCSTCVNRQLNHRCSTVTWYQSTPLLYRYNVWTLGKYDMITNHRLCDSIPVVYWLPLYCRRDINAWRSSVPRAMNDSLLVAAALYFNFLSIHKQPVASTAR